MALYGTIWHCIEVVAGQEGHKVLYLLQYAAKVHTSAGRENFMRKLPAPLFLL